MELDVLWLLAQLALDVLNQPGHRHLANLHHYVHGPDRSHGDKATCEDRCKTSHLRVSISAHGRSTPASTFVTSCFGV